jgi:hypothetical protein
MYTEKRQGTPTIRIPGRTPAMNSFSMLVPDTNPYNIMGRLGGKWRPRLPDVVMRPREKFSSYFSEIRAGKSNPPSAIIVIPVAPVMAVKKAHETSATTPSPPGIQPKRLLENLTKRVEVFPSAIRYPAKVKSGMANKTGALAKRKISIGMAVNSIPLT